MEQWVNAPAEYRPLRRDCRTVLVVLPFVADGTRLSDVLPLIEADHRILTVFTVVPTPTGARPRGAEEFLRANACPVLPWQQVVQCEFDLVLSAGPMAPTRPRGNPLVFPRKGELTESGPEVPSFPATGDLCYDRLLASIPFRAGYRRAFGLTAGQQLVVVTSDLSTLDRWLTVVDRLVAELPPDRYRVVAIAHPDVWHTLGGFQVRAWFADALSGGLALVPPEEDWRGVLVAADLVIGDDGPVARYGTALGLPTMTTVLPGRDTSADPVIEALHRHAPRLRGDRPLLDQIRVAMRQDRTWQDALPRRITTRPGEAGEILRRAMYDLLDLPEPARAVPCPPVPLPHPTFGEWAWWKESRHLWPRPRRQGPRGSAYTL